MTAQTAPIPPGLPPAATYLGGLSAEEAAEAIHYRARSTGEDLEMTWWESMDPLPIHPWLTPQQQAQLAEVRAALDQMVTDIRETRLGRLAWRLATRYVALAERLDRRRSRAP